MPSSAMPFRSRSRARRRRDARARSSSSVPALASSATAAHFPNRSFRAIWRLTLPVPAAAGRRAASAAAGGCVASQCRDDHAGLFPDGRLNRVGTAWRGKPILSAEQIEDIVAYLVTLRE